MLKHRWLLSLLVTSLVITVMVIGVMADETTHRYEVGESVTLWANHVGPHYNPLETYPYYESHVPVCKPNDPTRGEFKLEYKSLSLGEALQGQDLVKVYGIETIFRKNTPITRLCKMPLTQKEIQQYIYAIDNQYWYQYYLDDLPMWAMIGGYALTKKGDKIEKVPFVYTHQLFQIEWNEDRIISVNLTTSRRKPLLENTNEISFTYEVVWNQNTKLPFEQRFELYLEQNFFQHKIHWFSIINSFMMVLFLSAVVFMILIRTLHKDLAALEKHAKSKLGGDIEVGNESDSEFDIIGSGDSSDSGPWKMLHGDVFRKPTNLTLLCAVLGTGFHLLFLALFLIILSIANTWHDTRGALLRAFVIMYCVTSFIGGYFSGHFYLKWKGTGDRWIRTALWTACIFPFTVFLVSLLLNFLAVSYNALIAMPFTTMLTVFVMWLFITLPLTFVGTIVGRNFPSKTGPKPHNFPCQVNQFPRPIPSKPWYLSPLSMFLFGGILPFGSIFIELYFVFTSFWNYKFYYVYGFLLLVFLILIVVIACVSIVTTFFLLNSEDWKWVWHCVLVGTSTGFYVFLYSIYFLNTKTRMRGLFQLVFYYGITFMFCAGLSFMCAAIAFAATYNFVKRIYKDIKVD
ncbi:hypothetical protein C9374_008618 [Naegleria lovaniensis]|uniref:Transmembrane 9 superfamily member n=1 Tax=Naegleria lovaniensis TaxID=51637 RepID=A0AA88KHA6_NAELO|nr:uncharacterized protein C9374_008618 [Naegleria lovaniensis]KAG2377996.1 hypothetical protein C9374_008618 [Naegleria lovaniensis]